MHLTALKSYRVMFFDHKEVKLQINNNNVSRKRNKYLGIKQLTTK